MTIIRLPRYRLLAGVCVLLLAGIAPAAAQFLPTPQQGSASGVFPPPPGTNAAARQDPAFPPPPGQTAAPHQDPAFPPPPGQAAVRQAPAFPPASGPGSAMRQDAAFPAPGASPGIRPGAAAPGGGPQFANPAQRVCMDFPTMRDDVQKAFTQIRAASERKVSRQEACPLFKSAVSKEDKLLKFLETNRTLCGVPPQIISQVKTNHTHTLRIRDQICSNAPAPASGPSLSDALGAPIIADDSDAASKPGRGTFDTLTGNILSR